MVDDQTWRAVRAALDTTTSRFVETLASARPESRVVGEWTAADTAVHVAAIVPLYLSLLGSEDRGSGDPALDRLLADATLATIDEVNRYMMPRYPERDPAAVGARLRTDVDALLARTGDLDPSGPVAWLGGATVPTGGLLAHLLNELLVHGHDIARVSGADWTVPPAYAVHFFQSFMGGMLRYGYGSLLGQLPPRTRPATVEFRLRHAAPFRMVLGDRVLTTEPPGPGADAVVTADPATLVLMMFHRVSMVRAIGSGKVRLHGRRPWVMRSFLQTIRMP